MIRLPALPAPAPVELARRLQQQFAEWAPETFASAAYPQREMDAIRQAGLLHITLPGEALDLRHSNTPALLQLLRYIGQGNLSVGRIYEGHVNALQLIAVYGTPAQQQRWFADARAGHLFGVWNTEMQDGIHLDRQRTGKVRIRGSKSFCSGSVHVTRPIVPGVLHDSKGRALGWQMAIVPLDRHDPPVDKSFWTPLGMRNSVSHKIDFTGILLEPTDLLGHPGDYNRQPYLSGGAIRFAAVHLGGAAAVLEAIREYIRQLKRTEDCYHRSRVGQMAILVESGNQWLERSGRLTDQSSDTDEIIYYANMTRTAIASICTDCLRLAEHSAGARGMLHPYALPRLHADLTMYLRQPAPDAALEAVGKHYLDDHPTH